MTPLRQIPRLLRIAAVLVRYRLDDLVDVAHLYRPVKWLRAVLPRPPAGIAAMPRGARFAAALTELGPLFVKSGQILSTRRDLLPPDVADGLAALQDRVAPFPGELARAAVERELGAPVGERFARFDDTPLASASIAQVHAAALPGGREVVVKILRPQIHAKVARDLELLHAIAGLVQRFHPQADKLRPRDVVAEIEATLHNELDLQREGANASLLRRNFADSDDLYVPEVVWSHSTESVLTLERVYGIPVDDLAALDAAGIDRRALTQKGVRLFYTQVFRDNFFHADAHAGNIWVDPARRANPRFIALDCGIIGTLPRADLYWIAENFLALFERDYRRIVELHLRAGWIPPHVREDELEASVRTVCEPYFTRPLAEISLAEVVIKLLQTARRHELTLQPQLILLQKTLLNIEGVGRMLQPDIDIWATAKPVLERIWRERNSPRAVLRGLRQRFPDWVALAPELPRVAQRLVERTRDGGTAELRKTDGDPKHGVADPGAGRRFAFWLAAGASLLVAAAVLAAGRGPGALVAGVPAGAWIIAVAAVLCFATAWRRT